QSRFGEGFLAGLDVVALEPHDQRQLQPRFLNRRDNPRRDDIAIHDATKNVNENSFNVRVLQNDFEGGSNLLLAGAAAYVEEVSGLTAKMLDDIHGRHREPRAIDEARDVAVEFDVVETEFAG